MKLLKKATVITILSVMFLSYATYGLDIIIQIDDPIIGHH